MSIPQGDAPLSGWPLVIYGHGTGGGYRSQLNDAVAGRLAQATPSFATLAFDQVQHGPRRGEGEDAKNDPDTLFFNFVNPDAARGNPLQGAADILSILRFAQKGTLASSSETGSGDIIVDPAKIFYYGHSQGSTHGSIAVPFSAIPGAVMSGNGGGLANALINKTNPVNIAGAIPFALQDADARGKLVMGAKHPVLGLLQHYIDPADPLNFSPLFAVRPEAGQKAKSIFQTFGLDDTFAPPSTLKAFTVGAQLKLAPAPAGVEPAGENLLNIAEEANPVSDNVTIDATTVTAVCRQYAPPSGKDGHFVAQSVPEATDDIIGFFSALGSGTSPTVPKQ